MNVLIVGGTGMIGGHAAQYLRGKGHAVTLAARQPPGADTPLTSFPVVVGDYAQGGFTAGDLSGFQSIVFAAGADIRHIAPDADQDAFWRDMQSEGVPRFAALAKQAGVRRFVQLGSYYHQVMPHLIGANAYVRARALADEGARALADERFCAVTLNPPSIVGVVPGVPAKRYEKLIAWAQGRLDVEPYGPAGGTNYMSAQSLSGAIEGALLRGESGKAYLVGDENLRFTAFFQMFFDAARNPVRLREEDRAHPLLPDAFIVPGRGKVLAYDPDARETALLGYRRGDVRRAVNEIYAMAQGASA